MAYRLDKKDVEILKMLKKDSRTPMGLIGNKLEISKATVSRRVASMEEDGTITKYSLDIDHASIGLMKSLVMIQIVGSPASMMWRRRSRRKGSQHRSWSTRVTVRS